MGGKGSGGRNQRGDPEDLLPLTPVALNILLALADEERHGYGIGLEVRERTGGRMCLGPGTLYGSLKRMVDGGLVEESEGPTDDVGPEDERRGYDTERRRYYRLTGFGGLVLAAEVGRLEAVVRAAREKGAFPSQKGASLPGSLGRRASPEGA